MESGNTATPKVLSPCTIWLTGLSGAGKTTIAESLKEKIDSMVGTTSQTFILDGDVVRRGLNNDLGFTANDRAENIRRISEVSKLFNLSGKICIASFISPYEKDRTFAKEIHAADNLKFYEGYVSASLEVCEARDVKGLYKKARAGIIPNFTGVSDPYEAPQNPDMDIMTGEKSVKECVDECITYLVENGVLSTHASDTATTHNLYDFDEQLAKDAEEMDYVTIDDERIQLLHCLADGWAGKLDCFMNELELLETLHYKTVTSRDGQRYLHSVPITCPVSTETMEKLKGKDRVALRHHLSNEVLAVIENPSFYTNRKEEISARVFGTQSKLHPKVELIYSEGEYLITGTSLKVLRLIKYGDGLDDYRLSPSQVQQQAIDKSADVVYAFQLRNPLHSGHVMLLNSTRDMLLQKGYKNPVLLLHPCGGWTKDDDVPLDVRMKQHQALIDDNDLNKDQTILAIWPSPMFYGGPTEVLWHVASRLNAGVEYFIVGRDPAGIGHPEIEGENLYDPFHGQQVIELGKHNFHRHVDMVPFKVAAYNKVNKQMEFFNPAVKEQFDFISGSRMRQLARDGETPPDGFMNPNGWKVLKDYYTQLKE